MSAIPSSSPTPPSLSVSETPEQEPDLDNSVYEQPIDELGELSPGPNTPCYPYEIPEVSTLPGKDPISGNTSLFGHYQELNQLNVSTRDYQSLDVQSVPANPSCLESETSVYEPLRNDKESCSSQYEKINRN